MQVRNQLRFFEGASWGKEFYTVGDIEQFLLRVS